MIQPFLANVPQQILDDLKLRISHTRWPDEVTDSGWSYGTNLSYMKELTNYWHNTFDWRKVEAEINLYPNYLADINGYQIHFLHIKGKREKACSVNYYSWMARFFFGNDETYTSAYCR